MALHDGDVAEEIAAENEDACPGNRSADAVSEKSPVGHFAYAGDKRNEGSEDGHKACDYDGLSAVLFVEPMGFVKMFFAEDSHVFLVKNFGPDKIPYPVISIIAADSREEQKRPHKTDFENAVGHRGKRAGREKQGIARQKRCYDKSRFAEDDNKQNEINPGVILRDDRLEGFIEIQKHID